MKKHDNRFSRWMMTIILLICVLYGQNLNTWGKNKIIQNDVISYYAYLPAALIFNDLGFKFTKDLPADFEGTIWLQTAPNGKPILKMTMGLAIVWVPFFLLAHAAAHLSGISALGYSWPYSLSIFIAALFYMMAGLIFLRKMLLRHFSDAVTAVTLLLIVLATNLMYYVISEPGMSHVYNFGLIAAFLYYSLKWTEHPGIKHILVLGFLAGLIVLIRPVNIIVLLFPALIGVDSLEGLKDRIVNNWKLILMAGGAALLVILPQMLYWKAQSGQFVFNTYMIQGESFYFLKSELWNGLFSYRKGWLLYTPVMILALTGIFWMRKSMPHLFLPVIIFILVNIYIVFSWWCWWYGGSFGSRPMIDMYGIMAIPLAVFIEKAWRGRTWIKGSIIVLLLFMVMLNQFQMKQYRTSLLHWDSMTKEAYWGIFGKTKWPEGYDSMIKTPDYDKALRGESEYP